MVLIISLFRLFDQSVVLKDRKVIIFMKRRNFLQRLNIVIILSRVFRVLTTVCRNFIKRSLRFELWIPYKILRKSQLGLNLDP